MAEKDQSWALPDAFVQFSPYLGLLDHFYDGVIIADAEGRIVYINQTQTQIDDLTPEDALGTKVTDVYRVDDGLSPTMLCIQTGKSVENVVCYYRTRLGKVVNSICNVFPLKSGERIMGAIAFVRDFSVTKETFERASGLDHHHQMHTAGIQALPRPWRKLDNGTQYTFDDIIGRDRDFIMAVEAARLASRSPSAVMLYGETGTGKELLAQSIHNHGPRRNQPYVAINCAAIPENLLEGLLFGTARGAFTGAIDKPGLFERASGGTLFLDEVNSMSTGLQAKLLRALQEKRVRRVGSLDETAIDLKIISSVNIEPHQAVDNGQLRPDLLYRLAVVFIRVPPLRERAGDLEILIRHFLDKCNTILGKNVTAVSEEVFRLFRAYPWPGNVRELEHVIEGAMNLVDRGQAIDLAHLAVHIGGLGEFPERTAPKSETIGSGRHGESSATTTSREPHEERQERPDPRDTLAMKQARDEERSIREALVATKGNAAQAARILGLSPQLLHYKIRKHGIDPSQFRSGSRGQE